MGERPEQHEKVKVAAVVVVKLKIQPCDTMKGKDLLICKGNSSSQL